MFNCDSDAKVTKPEKSQNVEVAFRSEVAKDPCRKDGWIILEGEMEGILPRDASSIPSRDSQQK